MMADKVSTWARIEEGEKDRETTEATHPKPRIETHRKGKWQGMAFLLIGIAISAGTVFVTSAHLYVLQFSVACQNDPPFRALCDRT
jgi:hypothetical protein